MDQERPGDDRPEVRQEEVEDLRRERDALAARVAALQARTTARRRVWRPAVAMLLVIGTLSFTLSAAGWWARRNLTDTDVWVERVGPLTDDPAVRQALGAWLSDEVVELTDPAELFEEVLPERGQVLATPLANAVESFVRSQVDDFLASDRFERLWVEANELAHRAAVRLLRGESEAAQTRADQVVINLVPVINAALAELGDASPELLGREVDLPDLTAGDLPDAAIRRLEQALGVDLGDDFGQFVVYDHGRLSALQDGVDRARRWLVGLSVLTVVAFAGALWLSGRRRRTLLQMLAGLAVGIAVLRRSGLRGQSELLAVIPDQGNRAAAEAASDQFLDPLLAVTQNLLIGVALFAAAVVLSGPYPWVVRLRRRTADLTGSLVRTASRAGPPAGADAAAGDWLRTHRGALQIGGVAIVVLVLLLVDLSFFGLLVLATLVALGGVLLRGIPAAADAG